MLDSLDGHAPALRRLCLLPCLRLCYRDAALLEQLVYLSLL